ncbi:MAG: hypothetical protein VKJ04_12285 [Vampirovibrionales bacterium]|nr:hypothetical protein [Vampirovibrionales bacterium]
MRILIDTNIFIHLEEGSSLESKLAELDKVHRENNIQLLTHPLVLDDINRDRNEERRERSLSRLQRYPTLESPPDCSTEFSAQYGIDDKTPNEKVDNSLLGAVYADAVSFLVTEDAGIHRKAKRLGIDERVFDVAEAAAYLQRLYSVEPIVLPNIHEVYVHELKAHLDSSFFDTLREDYGEAVFNEWFIKTARDGRKAWYAPADDGSMGAICIFKDEQDEHITADMRLSGKILKLCCFKVGDNVRG